MISAILNPWVLLVWVGSISVAGFVGYGMGQDKEIADQSRVVAAVAQAADKAASAAAGQVAKIKFKNTTIRQTLESKTREVPYPVDCRLQPDVLSLLNSTPGIAPAASAPGGGELPPADPAR